MAGLQGIMTQYDPTFTLLVRIDSLCCKAGIAQKGRRDLRRSY